MKTNEQIQAKLTLIRRSYNSIRYRKDPNTLFIWETLRNLAEATIKMQECQLKKEYEKVVKKREQAFDKGDDKLFRAYLKCEYYLKWVLDIEDKICRYCRSKCEDYAGKWLCPNCWLPYSPPTPTPE